MSSPYIFMKSEAAPSFFNRNNGYGLGVLKNAWLFGREQLIIMGSKGIFWEMEFKLGPMQ